MPSQREPHRKMTPNSACAKNTNPHLLISVHAFDCREYFPIFAGGFGRTFEGRNRFTLAGLALASIGASQIKHLHAGDGVRSLKA